MCLIVDKKLHKKHNTPRIAERDILVYKALTEVTEFGGLSPYQYSEWTMGVRRTAAVKEDAYNRVHAGLHACTTANRAKFHLNYSGNGNIVCPAIIPKGSRVFFGDHDEIVSTSMIVYRNLRSLQKVHGKIAPGVKKHLIAKLKEVN